MLMSLQRVKKTLVLREIPEDGVGKLLSNKESWAACDIAVFVHDRSEQYLCRVPKYGSKFVKESHIIAFEVATHGEKSGLEVPCLIVVAKDDLDPYPSNTEFYKGSLLGREVSQDMRIEEPIPVSMALGNINNVFRRIMSAAQHPHLGIPTIKAWRNRKRNHRLVNRSPIFVSAMLADLRNKNLFSYFFSLFASS
ncbi:hypothetical protein HHK36_026633 [Tetracentron sinense]|uniref:Uncharacterized protein n=1 Tax=Tetracentron sinense TaxID=13715 RepID=A0A834YKZ7_TETSI|nr:hypothetical protein HHK36_026633 [Tetracentron sinense]